MKESQVKVYLDNSTYVTKVNGRAAMVRTRNKGSQKRRERLDVTCLDLLRGVFSNYSQRRMNESKNLQGKNPRVQKPAGVPFHSLPPPLFNPHANLVGSPSAEFSMGAMGPQPGIYKFGHRQMALLPLNSQGRAVILPQIENSYAQQPWGFTQPSNTIDHNFLHMSIDPGQFTKSPMTGEAVSEASVSVTKHVCAECGRLRSRKYQHENPLKPGETPIPAFCKKCQKDITSTEESDRSIRITEKRRKRYRRRDRKISDTEGDIGSSRDSVCSDRVRKNSKSKKVRDKSSEDHLIREEAMEKSSLRYVSGGLSENKDDAVLKHSGYTGQVPSSYSRSTTSSQRPKERKRGREASKYESRPDQEAQQLSQERVTAVVAKTVLDSRHAHSPPKIQKNNADTISTQSRSNMDSVSSETMPHRLRDCGDPMIILSRTVSEESSRRRRLERSGGDQGSPRDFIEIPHDTRPLIDDEIEVMTERFIYRPRVLSHKEENLENYKDEIIDKATAGMQKSYQKMEADAEALDYYRNDWSGRSEHEKVARRRLHPKDLERLRLPTVSLTSDMNSSSPYQASDNGQHPSQDQGSPRQLHENGRRHSQRRFAARDVHYRPIESENSHAIQRESYAPARYQDIEAQSNITHYKRPYVREATDRGTEKILEPSSKQSYEIQPNPNISESELTEEIERLDRRVTFLDLDRYDGSYDFVSEEAIPARVLRKERR